MKQKTHSKCHFYTGFESGPDLWVIRILSTNLDPVKKPSDIRSSKIMLNRQNPDPPLCK